MSTVDAGVIRQLSVSQVESFDPAQRGGCNRRWWFERIAELKPDQSNAQSDGDKGHELLAHYFRTGEPPKGRVKMGKAVRGTIEKGELPVPGPDLLVEIRFDGQEKLNANGQWLPLDVTETLKIADVPFDGFIDLTWRRGDVPSILDHKFSSDPRTYAKASADLIRTVQLPVYVLSQMPYWPDARQWWIGHHNVARTGVDSFIRSAVVTTEQVLERKASIEQTVEDMKRIAVVSDQNDVPYNRRACDAWGGCPHQSICRAFKERNRVEFSAEELAMLGDVFPTAAPAPAPAPAPQLAAQPESKPRRLPIREQCACGETLTDENSSRLTSGQVVHIGCPERGDADPAPIVPPDAPKSDPALASELPADPAPKPRGWLPKAKPAETPASPPASQPAAANTNVDAPRSEPPIIASSGVDPARLAALLESLAAILRTK